MSIDDDRIRFYLRHREQIEQWAALRGEAAIALDDWLVGLKSEIDALVSELGGDVVLCARNPVDIEYPGYLLFRSTWRVADKGAPQPSIGLEWVRSKTTLRGTFAPYVGLRSFRDAELGAAIRARADFKRCRAERKDAQSPYWAAYGYVLPTEPFPDDADAYRVRLLNALREAWRVYAPIVDAATASGTAVS